jgi:hypothetical protein
MRLASAIAAREERFIARHVSYEADVDVISLTEWKAPCREADP